MCEQQVKICKDNCKLNKKHLKWIDVSRSFAIICVVLCHAVERIYILNIEYISDISKQSRIFCFIVFTIGRCGVPIFLMISGYLLLGHPYDETSCKLFWKNNWLRLLVCYECWMIIYTIFLCFIVKQDDFSVIFLLQEMLFLRQVNLNHIWYMPMIIGMYLLIPFVANALYSLNCRVLIFPMIISVFQLCVFSTADVIIKTLYAESISIGLSEGFSGGIYGLYLIFGFLIRKNVFKIFKSEIICLTGIITFVLSVILQLWTYHHRYTYNIWYNCAFLMISTVCLFELFSRMKKIKFYNITKIIAYYSFAIYLIHNMIIELLTPRIVQTSIIQPVKVMLLLGISLILSILCAAIINQIPKLGKILFFIK